MNGELWDVEGKHYIDFAAGIAVINSHCNAAVTWKAAKFSHTAFQVTVYETLYFIGRALAAGYPLSGVIGRAEIMDSPAPVNLGGNH